jgi:hypothetical protein
VALVLLIKDHVYNMKEAILLLQIVLLLGACSRETRPDQDPAERKFSVQTLAKGDIDSVLDIHVYESRKLLRELMVKLYKRNPKELKKSPFSDIDKNISRVFDKHHDWSFKQLDYKEGIDTIRMTFDNAYQGDRVFSFIVGVSSMLMASYGDRTDFYMLDKVDAQVLYNCARNIEIAVWMLSNRRDEQGELYLYSNSLPNEETYLSYERLFGKLIANQDTIAIIMESKNKRIIKKVFQKMATAVFLPI